MPEPLMRGNQTLDALAAVRIGRNCSAREHVFKNTKELFGDLIIGLVAGVMKRDQDLVGKAAAISLGCPAEPRAISVSVVHPCHVYRTPMRVCFVNPKEPENFPNRSDMLCGEQSN